MRAVAGGGGGGRGRRSRRWRGRRGRGTGRRNCGGVGGSRAVGKKCGGAGGSRAGLSHDRSRVIPVQTGILFRQGASIRLRIRRYSNAKGRGRENKASRMRSMAYGCMQPNQQREKVSKQPSRKRRQRGKVKKTSAIDLPKTSHNPMFSLSISIFSMKCDSKCCSYAGN